jgi:hypothetical protein
LLHFNRSSNLTNVTCFRAAWVHGSNPTPYNYWMQIFYPIFCLLAGLNVCKKQRLSILIEDYCVQYFGKTFNHVVIYLTMTSCYEGASQGYNECQKYPFVFKTDSLLCPLSATFSFNADGKKENELKKGGETEDVYHYLLFWLFDAIFF